MSKTEKNKIELEAREVSADVVADVIASDRKLSDAFVVTVTDEVDRRAVVRELRRFRMLTVVGAFVGAFAVAGVTGLVKYVNSQVGSRVQTEFTDSRDQWMEDVLARVRSTLMADFKDDLDAVREEMRTVGAREGLYRSFVSAATELENTKGGFTPSLQKSILDYLRSMHGAKSPEYYLGKHDFQMHLENVIGKFAAANQDDAINRVDQMYSTTLEQSTGIAQTLVQHYGRGLVGDTRAPQDWLPDMIERFDRYVRAVQAVGYPEAALPFQVLAEYRRSGRQRSEHLTKLVLSARYLSDTERAVFHLMLIQLADWRRYMRRPNSEGDMIAEVCQEFMQEYDNELLGQIASPAVIEALTVRQDGEEDPEFKQAIAAAIARARAALAKPAPGS